MKNLFSYCNCFSKTNNTYNTEIVNTSPIETNETLN